MSFHTIGRAVLGLWSGLAVMAAMAAVSSAAPHAEATSTVAGKLELPAAPELAPMVQPGFVARSENSLQNPQPAPLAPFMFVVLDGTTSAAPPQVSWELVGESFAHPVVAAMAGADVVIKNSSKVSRALTSVEDPGVLPSEVLNPSGGKTIHVAAGKVVTIRDPDAPYVWGRVVSVTTPYIGYPDSNGKFDIPDVPDGTYHLRVFYKDAWLDVDQPVTLTPKTKTDNVTVKVASIKPAAAK